MAAETLAKVLLHMLRDEQYARAILENPDEALKQYKGSLSADEISALSRRIPPADVDRLVADPHVGAWRLLVHHINDVPATLKQELNQELAKRATQSIAIPCTGA
jgi:hypothetical protein